MDDQKKKQTIADIIFFISGRIPVNKKSVKDIYSKIIYFLMGNIPDDVSVGIRNDANEDVQISINEHPEFLVYRFYELINKPRLDIYNSVIARNISLLKSPKLAELLLITILKYELQFLRSFIENTLSQKQDKEIDEYFSARIEFISNYIKNNTEIIENDESILSLIIELVNLQIDIAIRQDKIAEKYGIFKKYINRNIHPKITKHLLVRDIEIAKEFAIKPQDELVNILHNPKNNFNHEEKNQLLQFIKSDPGNVFIFSMSQGGGNINIDHSLIKTVIKFIGHGNTKDSKFIDFFTIGIGPGNSKLIAKRITSSLDDPIVNKQIVGGLESQYVSDYNPNPDYENVEFQLQIEDFIHPQFDLEDEKIVEKDFSREERLIGRQFHPIKNLVIDFLLNARQKLDLVFQIPDTVFNINMFSNYSVEYTDTKSQEIIYKRNYLFTNPNSFATSKSIYFHKMAQKSLSSSYVQVSQLIKNSHIETEYLLQQFVYKLMIIVVKKSIELSGNYRYCWKLRADGRYIPNKEVEIQPLIMNQLRLMLEFSGISISKEPEISNGKLDFECSYNFNTRIFKCAIEIKNAHHKYIFDGITKQLPKYMEQTGPYGIFCFLWFKDEWFNEPREFENINDLEQKLSNKIPSDLTIDVIGIDCNKPDAPSTL